MTFSLRSQIVIVWWALIFTLIFTFSLIFLLHIVPPPDATMTSEEIKAWYESHARDIKIGAAVCGWTSAFFVPLAAVMAAQIRRHETGYPIWSQLTLISGGLTAIFLVLPPIAFGAAAYTPGRSADATAIMHEFGLLMLVTTDMWYVFMWVGLIVVSLRPHTVENTAFPRWFGYFCILSMSVFEFGVFAFLVRTGPVAWDGVVVWWAVFVIFFIWVIMACVLLLQALGRQLAAAGADSDAEVDLELAGPVSTARQP
ncbi:MAG: hypothetical protein ACT4PP_05855 [Sporichthyaceae bacterium]